MEGFSMNTPEELKYSKEHEWVKVDGDKAYIGITHFAQSELGDIVFVELPEVGDSIEKEESFGNVESVKTVSELYAPISGEVVAINEELEDSPEFVNESPYDKAWIVQVSNFKQEEIDALMSAAEYKEMTNE